MVSVASGGTADRIAMRILLKVLRAGSGIPARYSSTFFGAPLAFATELRLPDFTFFIPEMLQKLPLQVHPQPPYLPKQQTEITCWKLCTRIESDRPEGRPVGLALSLARPLGQTRGAPYSELSSPPFRRSRRKCSIPTNPGQWRSGSRFHAPGHSRFCRRFPRFRACSRPPRPP